MTKIQRKAQFDEDKDFSLLKFGRADLDVVRSSYNLGVNEGLPEKELEERLEAVNKIKKKVDAQTLKYQEAKSHRLALDAVLTEATAKETVAKKALDDHLAKLAQLEKAKQDRTLTFAKDILTMPVIDGFNGPLKIDQIWLPKLTLNNNFKDVARFDRCVTCHQAIDKTAPGGLPAYPARPDKELLIKLKTPTEAPAALLAAQQSKEGYKPAEWLEKLYGLKLADRGLINPTDVTISVARSVTPSADAGLQVGDVIKEINGAIVADNSAVNRALLYGVAWGKPIELLVERGLPHPFSSHPRLDLYLGSLSPHKMQDMGCTICHEGQGSATSFQWASHTPNSPHQATEWADDHGWFNNHHWIYPMRPDRFVESSCLKCHQDLAELEPSERFPDPPAPKLMEGFDVIRSYGCFGCHEINGFDGPTRRRGPDIRTEPPYGAAALQVLADPSISPQEKSLAHEVAEHPDRTQTRKLLAELIVEDFAKKSAPQEKADVAEKPAARLAAATHSMAGILGADDETPGQYRKPGPSLRYVKSKLSSEFLQNWIRNPFDFRPTTKMPRFFGLDDHLHEIKRDKDGRPEMKQKLDDNGNPVMRTPVDALGQPLVGEEPEPVMVPVYVDSEGITQSKKFEPIEVRAAAEYLLNASQPFEYLEKPKDVSEAPSAERGKKVFQIRGCLACHTHDDFPDAKSTQGPNLSRIGNKLTTPEGAKWLYSWVREPMHYHGRTVMPNLFLDPIKDADGKLTDPAADVTAFLLGSKQEWQPKAPPPLDEAALDELARQYMQASFTNSKTTEYLKSGIPEKLRSQLKVDEQLLVQTPNMTAEENLRHKVLYVGRRTIGRLGCVGCHDIPGFEDSKPIGTGLADWGRKEPSKLAFEQVVQYIAQQNFVHGEGHVQDIEEALDPHHMPDDQGFFTEKVINHEREGFIWQKLREPRSYDYRMTENKDYIDRLRMPKFNLNDAQREAVITFVLGLVAEPPAAQYVYSPQPRRKAIVEGEKLINKFNCNGCHTFAMETWDFTYDPKTFQDPPAFEGYPFEAPHFSPAELAASKKVDRRGWGHATVTGMVNPTVGGEDEEPEYYMALWKSVPINGQPWMMGGPEVSILRSQITGKRPPVGGDFARMLQPIVLENERSGPNPNAKESDSFGWVPPPLIGEGAKVQTEWLHNFLLNPYPIRPAVALRMPRFNMSSAEASTLANYFAAMDNVPYPYHEDHRTDSAYLAQQDAANPKRLPDAMQLVTSNKYCVQCHLLGDYTPPGPGTGLAPNLDRVYQRIRGDWLQVWLAKPKRKLPFTGMPENFLPGKPAPQELFPGTSLEQLEGVEDFMLNYDTYMNHKTSIRSLVKPAEPEPDGEKPAADAAGGQ
jgi:mono/diheme cytochrome c family protein